VTSECKKLQNLKIYHFQCPHDDGGADAIADDASLAGGALSNGNQLVELIRSLSTLKKL
jgi:hypothetical protein